LTRSQKRDKWALRVCRKVSLWKYKATAIVQYAYLVKSKVTENVQRSMKLCIPHAKRAAMRAPGRREAAKVTIIVPALLTGLDGP
jgi:hypothetical protein